MCIKYLICILIFSNMQRIQSLQCSCTHLNNIDQCQTSAKCQWYQLIEKCQMNPQFVDSFEKPSYCQQFSEDDCINNQKCAFHLGKCLMFTQCSDYLKDKCTQTTNQCVSNGQICIPKTNCSEYINQISCQNLNLEGKYCIWKKIEDQMKCIEISNCEDLPTYLLTDQQCSQQINSCTVKKQDGCMSHLSDCNQYKYSEQCNVNIKGNKCFWEEDQSICLDKFCENKQLTTHEECQHFLDECTTNGSMCIKKTNCKNYLMPQSCKFDEFGKKCIYFEEKCYEKDCIYAPQDAITMEQCQKFGIECVPKKKGSCKIIPQSCEELETEDSCFIIGEINKQKCIWNQTKQICKIKQCNDAPINFNHQQCIKWLQDYECILGENFGCIENVNSCEQIKNLLSCDKNIMKQNCLIENQLCVDELCINLKYPFYQNSEQCEQKLSICTYDIIKKNCINKECQNLESSQCNFDYQYNTCNIPSGCQHKVCESASLLYTTHYDCQNWDANCTVFILVAQGVMYQNGCIKKSLNCQDFIYQQQCISSLQDIPCYWNINTQKCEFQNCNNAPQSFNTLDQCKQWVKYHNFKCIIKQNGGCIDQKETCQLLSDQVQCEIGAINNTCYWNNLNLQCEDRTCENSSQTFNTNLQCRQWLSKCKLHSSGLGCQLDSGIYTLCTSAPDSIIYNSPEECQAWNPNCTLKLGQACDNLLECNKYLKQEDCKIDMYDQPCFWNGIICESKKCSDYSYIPTSHSDCQNFSPVCTIKSYSVCCTSNIQDCQNYSNPNDCKLDSYGWKCYYYNQICYPKINYCYNYSGQSYQYFNSQLMGYTEPNENCQFYFRYTSCDVMPSGVCNTEPTYYNQICKWNQQQYVCEEYIPNIANSFCTSSIGNNMVTCQNYGSNCKINPYNFSCSYKDCSTVPQNECLTILLDNMLECSWKSNICQIRSCTDRAGLNLNIYDCLKWMDNCTYDSITKSCEERFSCNQETNAIICNQSSTIVQNLKTYCYWDKISCQIINNCEQIFDSLSPFFCQNKLSYCTSNSKELAKKECSFLPKFCHFLSQENCFITSTGENCNWDSISQKCVRNICINIITDFSNTPYKKCQKIQPTCVFNSTSNRCSDIIECEDINNNKTHESCQEYCKFCYLNETYSKCELNLECSQSMTYYDSTDCYKFLINKRCRKRQFTQSCQPFAQNCSLYKYKQTCLQDYNSIQCYWSQLNQNCINFSCSIIEETVNTHEDCQVYSKQCTIDYQNKCKNLESNCSNYLFESQCQFDINMQLCSWINNKCVIDNCRMAIYNIYTINDCEIKYGSNCTINQDRTGCIIKYDSCNFYNKFQCLSLGIKNSKDIECFWDQQIFQCSELKCENAPSFYQYLTECESFNKNCETSKCRKALCDDFKHKTDLECSKVMPNNFCSSNGVKCIERKQCENVGIQEGCTFSIDLKECQWIEEQNRCATKSCETAPNSIKTHIQCQTYLAECTNKKNGGCLILSTCTSIQSEDACQFDVNNQACLWNSDEKKCIFLSCETICGDGIVGGNEECDDGNVLPYDGCYKCKFQCQLGCLSCSKNICYECIDGYYLNKQNTCIEFCGDGLIVGQEECDDMNQIEQDGCYNCKYQCHQYCLQCIQGICVTCFYGWEQYNNQCRSVCGNGLVVQEYEQCDDGNIENFDGCNSKCEIENDWICNESQITGISECQNLIKPKFILENLSKKKDSEQIILLSFSQPVKLIQNVIIDSIISIEVTNNVPFIVYLKPIQEAQLSLSKVEYQLYITLLEKIDNPQAMITFSKSIFKNEQNLELISLNESINLGNPFVLSQYAQSKLNSTIEFNQIMIYVFIGSSSLSILTGNFELFFNMLALLQQLSYVRYLNIPFPSHLSQYLKVFKVISFQPIYDKLQIDELFKKLNLGKPPFIQSKFQSSQIQEENNSFFLINAKSFYLTFFTSLTLYGLANLIIQLNKYICNYLLKQKNFIKAKKIHEFFVTLTQFSIKTKNYFYYSGLIKIFISTQYQLIFSAYNQYSTYNFYFDQQNAFEIFNSFNALLALILPNLFIFYSFILVKKQYVQRKITQCKIFYENIKPKYWSRFYLPFTMIRVSIYMGIITFMSNNSIIQVVSLTILNNVYCFYIISVTPLKAKVEAIKILQRELTFTIIVAGFFPYCLDIDENMFNILGWVHIALFSSIIGSNILIDFCKQVFDLRINYQNKKIKEQLRLKKLYHSNILSKFIEGHELNLPKNKQQQKSNLSICFDNLSQQQL